MFFWKQNVEQTTTALHIRYSCEVESTISVDGLKILNHLPGYQGPPDSGDFVGCQ